MQLTLGRRFELDKNLVGFEISDVHYAVNIMQVREIINPLDIIPVANAPQAVAGVADHRGAVVPVLDVRNFLGLPQVESSRRTKWIVVDVTSEESVALIVDRVTEVFGAGEPQKRTMPDVAVGPASDAVSAVYSYQEGLVFVLDVGRLSEGIAQMDLKAHSDLLPSSFDDD